MPITDRDIVNALNGTPLASTRQANEAIVNVLRGVPTAEEQAADDAIAEAFGHKPKPAASEDAPPVKRRGDDLEAVAIWAAGEAASTATTALAQAIMRADGSKGIYAAEAEAKSIAKEAYTEAAKGSPYEDKRQEAVARIVTKLAEKFTSNRLRESTAKPAAQPQPANAPAPAARPRQKRESRSAITGSPITYYS